MEKDDNTQEELSEEDYIILDDQHESKPTLADKPSASLNRADSINVSSKKTNILKHQQRSREMVKPSFSHSRPFENNDVDEWIERQNSRQDLKEHGVKVVKNSTDLLLKIAFLVCFGILIYLIATGSFKSDINMDAGQVNVTTTTANNYSMPVYNNVTIYSTAQSNVTINAPTNVQLSLPIELTRALILFLNNSNHS